jgi:hypothetical protein
VQHSVQLSGFFGSGRELLGVLIFCLFDQEDGFYVGLDNRYLQNDARTAFGLHRLEATAPRVCQICARPPSTASSLAVMKLLSSDARKAAAAPISDGSAMRWSGVIEA